MRRSKVIHLDPEVYEKLAVLKGRLEVATARPLSMNDALRFWLSLSFLQPPLAYPDRIRHRYGEGRAV